MTQIVNYYAIYKQLYTPRPLAITYDMANFDFATALKLTELSSTKAADINSFLELVTCYHDTLGQQARAALINFIKHKIKGEAKVRFGNAQPSTLQELTTVLYTNVLAAETEEELLAKILSARQGKRNLKDFVAYLADLSSRLSATMIKNSSLEGQSSKQAVRLTCDKIILRQFKTHCHEEVKLVLAASRAATLDEALAVASASNLGNQHSSVNFVRYHNRQHQNMNYKKKPNNYNNNSYRPNNYNPNRNFNNNANFNRNFNFNQNYKRNAYNNNDNSRNGPRNFNQNNHTNNQTNNNNKRYNNNGQRLWNQNVNVSETSNVCTYYTGKLKNLQQWSDGWRY